MEIKLNGEQERFLQEKLQAGKYSSVNQVIAEAFNLLQEKERLAAKKQPLQIIGEEEAEKLLQEKVKQLRQELKENQNRPPDPARQKLAQELKELFNKTQAIPGIQDITEEEIEAEIEAYRRGK
jgi:Arc/MetJ-type ribon-helix-helix transcriptional regulator